MNEEILRIRGLDKKLIKPSDKPQSNHLKQKNGKIDISRAINIYQGKVLCN